MEAAMAPSHSVLSWFVLLSPPLWLLLRKEGRDPQLCRLFTEEAQGRSLEIGDGAELQKVSIWVSTGPGFPLAIPSCLEARFSVVVLYLKWHMKTCWGMTADCHRVLPEAVLGLAKQVLSEEFPTSKREWNWGPRRVSESRRQASIS